jgi:hypothetical protein
MAIKRIQRGRNHAYTINGMKAVGVTTAISKGMPKPALMYWAAKATAEEAVELLGYNPPQREEFYKDKNINNQPALIDYLKKAPIRQRDDAAVRGTKVHNIAEKLTKGLSVEVPEELVGHVESAMRFLSDWRVKPLLVEKTVGSYQWGYAGTFDLIGEVPDGRRILFDYKTGKSGIWPDVALQLAAYRWADSYVADDGLEIPLKEVGIDECKAVWVRADGYDVVPLVTDATVLKAFLHVLQVAKTVDVMDAWKGPTETRSPASWLTP